VPLAGASTDRLACAAIVNEGDVDAILLSDVDSTLTVKSFPAGTPVFDIVQEKGLDCVEATMAPATIPLPLNVSLTVPTDPVVSQAILHTFPITHPAGAFDTVIVFGSTTAKDADKVDSNTPNAVDVFTTMLYPAPTVSAVVCAPVIVCNPSLIVPLTMITSVIPLFRINTSMFPTLPEVVHRTFALSPLVHKDVGLISVIVSEGETSISMTSDKSVRPLLDVSVTRI